MAYTSYLSRFPGGFHDLPTQDSPIDSQFLTAVDSALVALYSVSPTANQVPIWDGSKFSPGLIADANVSSSAAIAYSKLALAGSIVNADIASGAAIALSKLAVPGGNLAKIGDITLGSDTATIDFTSIPSTYAHLLAVCYCRSTNAVATEAMVVRINNDSSANYLRERLRVVNTTVSGDNSTGSTGPAVFAIPGASATANFFGAGFVLFPSYSNSATLKSWVGLGGAIDTASVATAYEYSTVFSMHATITAAINQVTFAPNGFTNNFKTGSRITLYGLGTA